MAGDATEDVQTVWDLLDESLWYANAIKNGGSNDEGTFYASDNPEVKAKITELEKSIKKFIETAKHRYDTRKSSTTVGSGVDQTFDDTYETILAALNNIIERSTRNNDVNALATAGNIKFLLADGHLFFEEYLSGDASVSFTDVSNQFGEALNLSRKLGNNQLTQQINTFIDAAKERHISNQNVSSAGSEVDQEFDDEYENFITLADEAESMIQDSMAEHVDKLYAARNNARLMMLILLGVSVIIAFAWAFGVTANITKSLGGKLSELVNVVNKVSKGDLTVDINTSTSTGLLKYVGEMVDNLENMIIEIKETSEYLKNASIEINSNAQQMAQGANEQASSVEEVSSSMEEMAANIQQNTENAQQTESISENAAQGIEKVGSSSAESLDSVTLIAEKIAIINDIAFQTNLLALVQRLCRVS